MNHMAFIVQSSVFKLSQSVKIKVSTENYFSQTAEDPRTNCLCFYALATTTCILPNLLHHMQNNCIILHKYWDRDSPLSYNELWILLQINNK